MSHVASLPHPAAVILDLDGTLVDTVETRIRAWMQVFEEVGMPADRMHVARLIGADGKRLAREVAEVSHKHLDDARAEAIDKRSGEIYDELNTSPRPIAGARRLLIALSASRLPWAIATSSRCAQVGVSVQALRLPTEPRIIDGSHVEHAKPAPDLLLRAADELETPPHACWYAGDATWDMLAARAATMIGIGLPYGAVSRSELLSSGAQVVVSFRGLHAELERRGLIAS
jgi:beta-phosphoglucomutase-like phosphatase (HAD superfamily)